MSMMEATTLKAPAPNVSTECPECGKTVFWTDLEHNVGVAEREGRQWPMDPGYGPEGDGAPGCPESPMPYYPPCAQESMDAREAARAEVRARMEEYQRNQAAGLRTGDEDEF